MTTIRTSHLEGAALDWAVAKANGLTPPERIICPECHGNGEVTLYGYGTITEHASCPTCNSDRKGDGTVPMPPGHRWWHSYSTSWEHAGPLIERELIQWDRKPRGRRYYAYPEGLPITKGCPGDTLLQAAMRAYVNTKLGDTVDVPDELTA